MSGRRRHARFAVAQPWEGTLRILRDVTVVDDADARGLLVFSHAIGVPGEVVALELAGAGTVVTLVVCVVESRPVVVDGAVRHALRLTVLDQDRRAERGNGLADVAGSLSDVLVADDLVGVIVREVPVRVLNVGGSGCLMESARAVEYGTTATLTMHMAGEDYADALRVSRCDRIEGTGTRWLIGAEFLWTSLPASGSLRRVARTLQQRAGRMVTDTRFESAVM